MTNEPRPHDHLNLTRSAHHDKHSQKRLRLKNSAVPDQNVSYFLKVIKMPAKLSKDFEYCFCNTSL